jgi:ArsR family transcriptional regulator
MPDVSPLSVSLEPAHNALYSLWLLIPEAGDMSGVGEWVSRTRAALTSEERETLHLILFGLYHAVVPEHSWSSFPAFVDHLATCDPVALRDKMLRDYAGRSKKTRECAPVTDESWSEALAALESVDAYLGFLRERFDQARLDEELEARAYSYVVDPPAMQELIVAHLREMWSRFLAPEWERVLPMLQDSVTAFQQLDLSNMSKLEAARLVTGQPLREEKWERMLEQIERVIFVPTAHTGPYLGKLHSDDTVWMLFGARLPEGVSFHAPDLSRAEIIVRLNTLADDNRLRILKLISEKGELCSQEIMERLELSQSAASRHLKQLSASGYLAERRRSGSKCYALELERIQGTLDAISNFLLGA